MKWEELLRSTRRVSPTSLYNDPYSEGGPFHIQYDKDTKELTFTKIFNSKHLFYGNILRYEATITFLDVDPHQNIQKTKYGIFPRPDVEYNDIRVSCTCASYRFTGAYPNARVDAAAKKVPRGWHNKSHRKSRNPFGAPMVCKHIIFVVNWLLRSELITSGIRPTKI